MSHRLGSHAGSSVSMDAQLTALDALLEAAFLDESFGQAILFPVSDHPANHVAAEDIQDHVEVKVSPFNRSLKLGDIPRPNLIGGRSKQFGLCILGMPHVSPALFDISMLICEETIHRPHRTMILTLIQQCGITLARGFILESLGV